MSKMKAKLLRYIVKLRINLTSCFLTLNTNCCINPRLLHFHVRAYLERDVLSSTEIYVLFGQIKANRRPEFQQSDPVGLARPKCGIVDFCEISTSLKSVKIMYVEISTLKS